MFAASFDSLDHAMEQQQQQQTAAANKITQHSSVRSRVKMDAWSEE